jgi:hypothetical protein
MHRITEDRSATARRAYRLLETGALLEDAEATHLRRQWAMAQASSFAPGT